MWYTLLLYLNDHTGKKGKIESAPLYSTFKLTKYRKNVKLAILLMETLLKIQNN